MEPKNHPIERDNLKKPPSLGSMVYGWSIFCETEVAGISLAAITLAGISAVLRSMRAVWQHDLLMDTATSVTLG